MNLKGGIKLREQKGGGTRDTCRYERNWGGDCCSWGTREKI